MAERTDLITITLTKYADKNMPTIGIRYLGRGRRAFDFFCWAIIVELWFIC